MKLCEHTRYPARVSSTTFPNAMAVEAAKRLNFSVQEPADMKRSLLELTIYYSSLDVTHIKQNPKYRVEDIFSNVGGLLGLFMGISVVSLLQLLEFIAAVISGAVAAHKTRKRGEARGKHLSDF